MILGVGVVAIGRNEGERLRCCLRSALRYVEQVIYVDSGSTDDSVALARDLGVHVVKLDMSTPFTASRARNAGYRAIVEIDASLRYIQFVDGDCELLEGWLQEAVAFLDASPGVGAVCGRRRERYPERSIYNELCDIEWDVRPGPAQYFGGDVLIRTGAIAEVGGYRDSLIAGEEPELALRMRRRGWTITVLDLDMTLHDANMVRFRQWWLRMKRSGYAYAAGAHLHGLSPERHWTWQVLQAWIWVPGVLGFALLLTMKLGWWGLIALSMYPLQCGRLFVMGDGARRRRILTAVSCTLVRFPEFAGQVRYLSDVLSHRRSRLIEYK